MSFVSAAAHLIHRERPTVLHALGPTIELLTADTGDPTAPGLIRGSVPAGHVVPLHAHDEPETFCVLSGALDAVQLAGTEARWVGIGAGGILHVPPRARHAFRNTGAEPAVALIVTAPSMVRFFERIGEPLDTVVPGEPPSPEAVERFLAVAAERGDWNASPEENAAVGISLAQD